MSGPLVATLNIPFTSDEGLGDNAGKNRIVLTQVTKRLNSFGQLVARCFPSRGVTFTASVGKVEPMEVRPWSAFESLKFSNSSSASLKYPGATDVVLNTTMAVLMQKSKDALGHTTIRPALGVTLRWDADEELVVAERSGQRVEVYGACFVQYTALYQLLAYSPSTLAKPVGGGDYAFVWSVGTIFAYNDYTVETLEMDIDISDSPSWVEFARVTSKIVLDARGTWEFPPNWKTTFNNNRDKVGDQREDYPADGEFPDHPQAGKIDAYNSFVDTRVHHLVEVNSAGMLRHTDYNNGGDDYWAWFNPYFGYSTYNPEYEIVYADPPGGKKASNAAEFQRDQNNTTWRDVFLSVDKKELETDLEDWYPGADKYSRPKPP